MTNQPRWEGEYTTECEACDSYGYVIDRPWIHDTLKRFPSPVGEGQPPQVTTNWCPRCHGRGVVLSSDGVALLTFIQDWSPASETART